MSMTEQLNAISATAASLGRDLGDFAERVAKHGVLAIGDHTTAYDNALVIMVRAYGLAGMCNAVVRCQNCSLYKEEAP